MTYRRMLPYVRHTVRGILAVAAALLVGGTPLPQGAGPAALAGEGSHAALPVDSAHVSTHWAEIAVGASRNEPAEQRDGAAARRHEDVVVSPVTDLRFGTVFRGQQATVSHTDPRTGKVVIEVERHPVKLQILRVSISMPTQLRGESAAVPYEGRVHFSSRRDNPEGAEPRSATFEYEVCPRYNVFGKCGLSFGGSRTEEVYLYLHGSVNVTDQPAGFYESKIQVEASAWRVRGF